MAEATYGLVTEERGEGSAGGRVFWAEGYKMNELEAKTYCS